ncbi:MAG: hypothetical protein ACRC3H_23765 [Lachnospiraceae bacterium]
MTVNELITKLEKCDREAEVRIMADDPRRDGYVIMFDTGGVSECLADKRIAVIYTSIEIGEDK